jgi:hypothetical protein
MNRWFSIGAGLILLCFGGFALIRGASVTTKRSVLEVGDFKMTADERRTLPPWAGGLAVGVGVALLVTGIRRQTG